MGSKTISKCASCGYPLAAEYPGQVVSCPFCSTINEAISGVNVPTSLFWSALAFVAGVLLSPRIRRQASKYAG
jgi:phage FluMu protein Com